MAALVGNDLKMYFLNYTLRLTVIDTSRCDAAVPLERVLKTQDNNMPPWLNPYGSQPLACHVGAGLYKHRKPPHITVTHGCLLLHVVAWCSPSAHRWLSLVTDNNCVVSELQMCVTQFQFEISLHTRPVSWIQHLTNLSLRSLCCYLICKRTMQFPVFKERLAVTNPAISVLVQSV